ncbi:BF3164 family lipoprotein [Bacteroides sp. UBA939]|uniref:BF3164 family lipoprotein n=1 Tax=Bacteroides sp. UBA939 TaxID=1946092 RepID=UPI0025BC21E3|nr:BF3164 family lipoprotein [Bacteroides sp. UBA939]
MKSNLVGILLLFSACSGFEQSSPSSDFKKTITLNVIDSIDLEELNILNPYSISFKDSFLVFTTPRGKRELQFLNLRSMSVHTRNVIGQGVDEMPQYSVVRTNIPYSFRFSDYRKGRIYEMDLKNLKTDSTAKHSLVRELPVEEDELFLRLFETENYIYAIGLLKEGRIFSFDKQTSTVRRDADYPTDENVNKLGQKHKGTLFNSTLMVGDAKHLVASCFGLIDFYEILPGGGLVLKRKHHYFFPKFTSQEYGVIISFERDNMFGFTGIDSDERFVYLLYSGKSIRDAGENALNCSDLFIYDWEGNPIEHFLLSKPLYGFSLCGNLLYGLSRVDTPKVYVYSLR